MIRCCALAVLACTVHCEKTSKDKEKAEKTLKESIEAASIIRATGPYDNSSACTWPECAPTCEDCGSKGIGSCMIPGIDECPWSAKCTLGSCFCSKGYCAHGSQCKFRHCRLGAMPPTYPVSNSARQLADLGPALPSNATVEEWHEFFVGSTKLPLVLLAVGVAMGVVTCLCIFGHCAWEPQWMPTSPIILLVLCLLTVAFISFGVVSRAAVVNDSFNKIGQQLGRVQKSLRSSVNLAQELEAMATSFQAVVDDLPNTCNKLVPGATQIMGIASEKANEKLVEMKEKVSAFSSVSHAASHAIDTAISQEWLMKMVVVVGPMLPLVLMALWTLAIAIAVLISWQSSNPKVAKRADDMVIECGAPMTCCLTMLAVVLASSYLWVGILVGGVCLNLDGNAISLIHAVNFTELSHFKFHIDPVLEGAAKYYILGSQENPMISMIEDVERDASALYTVYTNATWATTPAQMVCNGVKQLNATEALAACTESVGFAREILSARNIYPYYKTLGHELMCDTMLQGMTLLVIYSAVVSVILMPLVAICADVDLRKWENYKEQNYENHYDLSHELQEKFPFLGQGLQMPSPSQHSSPMPSPHGTWSSRMPWQT